MVVELDGEVPAPGGVGLPLRLQLLGRLLSLGALEVSGSDLLHPADGLHDPGRLDEVERRPDVGLLVDAFLEQPSPLQIVVAIERVVRLGDGGFPARMHRVAAAPVKLGMDHVLQPVLERERQLGDRPVAAGARHRESRGAPAIAVSSAIDAAKRCETSAPVTIHCDCCASAAAGKPRAVAHSKVRSSECSFMRNLS